jgi:predicted amidophosphoribosyltransferase
MVTFLLLKPEAPKTGVIEFIERLRETAKRHRVRCPSCGWQPAPSSRWSCVPTGAPEHFPDGCGAAWHTFETRGRCPGCSHQWRYTACLQCHAWAKHDDWYTVEDDDE